jgi:hypothetical protein
MSGTLRQFAMPMTVWLPGRVIKRDDDGSAVQREPSEPAPSLLTEDETVRLLRMDELAERSEASAYQTLYAWRRENLLRVCMVAKQVRYPLDEVLNFIRTKTDGAGRCDPCRK